MILNQWKPLLALILTLGSLGLSGCGDAKNAPWESDRFFKRSVSYHEHTDDGKIYFISSKTISDPGDTYQLIYVYDYDADGEVDEASITDYVEGKVVRSSSDKDADGVSDGHLTMAYGKDGEVSSYSRDYDGDGKAENSMTVLFNDDDEKIGETFDSDGDGKVDVITSYVFEEDLLVLARSDSDMDGQSDGQVIFDYDLQGNLIGSFYDNGIDGAMEYIRTWTYNDDRQVLTQTEDTDGDGKPENILTNSYDVDGNQISMTSDKDCDGNPEYVQTMTYDDSGRLMTTTAIHEGKIDWETTNTYYGDTLDLKGQSTDTDGDGKADSIVRVEHIYGS